MRERGVGVFCGKWLIEGLPQVILFDIGSVSNQLANWRNDFFERSRISGPYSDSEFNDCILYGYACAWFIGEYLFQYKEMHGNDPITICHFHEWLSGIGLIMTRLRKMNVATIFTTHATLLGRYLCADPSVDFYNNLESFDVDFEAGHRQIYHRYCVERASANLSHVFTGMRFITNHINNTNSVFSCESNNIRRSKRLIKTTTGCNNTKWTKR